MAADANSPLSVRLTAEVLAQLAAGSCSTSQKHLCSAMPKAAGAPPQSYVGSAMGSNVRKAPSVVTVTSKAREPACSCANSACVCGNQAGCQMSCKGDPLMLQTEQQASRHPSHGKRQYRNGAATALQVDTTSHVSSRFVRRPAMVALPPEQAAALVEEARQAAKHNARQRPAKGCVLPGGTGECGAAGEGVPARSGRAHPSSGGVHSAASHKASHLGCCAGGGVHCGQGCATSVLMAPWRNPWHAVHAVQLMTGSQL
jgi:hypothetical protein